MDSVRAKEAIEVVRRAFPFNGYMDRRESTHESVAHVLLTNLAPNSRVLDFGSGPCDLSALCSLLGYEAYACDDLMDPWHRIPGNVSRIADFTADFNVRFTKLVPDAALPFAGIEFDMVMLHAVLEHLHDSPRELLIELVGRLKVDGLLYITVPNAVNIRKRMAVLVGKTNHPPYQDYYWSDAPWRGHVREYVKDDLRLLASNLNVEVLSLRGSHHMVDKIPPVVRQVYRAVTVPFSGWKDSWSLVARKGENWRPAAERPRPGCATTMTRLPDGTPVE